MVREHKCPAQAGVNKGLKPLNYSGDLEGFYFQVLDKKTVGNLALVVHDVTSVNSVRTLAETMLPI